MNPLYQSIMSGRMPQGRPVAQTPMQKMQQAMQAMSNPAAFVKRMFPDIPDSIMNNPNLIMQYLQQTRGITPMDIQNVKTEINQGGGTPWQQ